MVNAPVAATIAAIARRGNTARLRPLRACFVRRANSLLPDKKSVKHVKLVFLHRVLAPPRAHPANRASMPQEARQCAALASQASSAALSKKRAKNASKENSRLLTLPLPPAKLVVLEPTPTNQEWAVVCPVRPEDTPTALPTALRALSALLVSMPRPQAGPPHALPAMLASLLSMARIFATLVKLASTHPRATPIAPIATLVSIQRSQLPLPVLTARQATTACHAAAQRSSLSVARI